MREGLDLPEVSLIHGELAVIPREPAAAPMKPPPWTCAPPPIVCHPRRTRRGPIEANRSLMKSPLRSSHPRRTRRGPIEAAHLTSGQGTPCGVIHGELAVA